MAGGIAMRVTLVFVAVEGQARDRGGGNRADESEGAVSRAEIHIPEFGDEEDETCGTCGGFGGGHDCGEDTCCCLNPVPNVPCDECGECGEPE